MKLKKIKVSDLKFDDHNANVGTSEGAALLRQSVEGLGFGRSVLVDRNDKLVAGNKTTKQAIETGAEEAIVVETDGTKLIVVKRTDLDLDDYEDPRGRALALADNRVSEANLKWNPEQLNIHFDAAMKIDMPALIFHPGEKLHFPPAGVNEEGDESDENLEETQTLIKSGDFIQIGRHKMVCGDCADIALLDALMDGQKAKMCFTDPPYGVAYVGRTKDKLTIENDDIDEKELGEYVRNWFDSVDRVIGDGAYVLATVPAGPLFLIFAQDWKNRGWLRQILVWNKSSMVLGRSEYHYKHEPILFGWKPGSRLINEDRTRSSVWEFDRPSASRDHPTMKPIPMWEYGIMNHTVFNDLLFEPFLGSGTTMIAAQNAGRICYGFEISPNYCQVVVNRMQNLFPEIDVFVNGERYKSEPK